MSRKNNNEEPNRRVRCNVAPWLHWSSTREPKLSHCDLCHESSSGQVHASFGDWIFLELLCCEDLERKISLDFCFGRKGVPQSEGCNSLSVYLLENRTTLGRLHQVQRIVLC